MLAMLKSGLRRQGANLAVAAAAVAAMTVLDVDMAMAGADTTFDTALTC